MPIRTQLLGNEAHPHIHVVDLDDEGEGLSTWSWRPWPHRHAVDFWRVVPVGWRLFRRWRHTHELAPTGDLLG